VRRAGHVQIGAGKQAACYSLASEACAAWERRQA
jgi:hypothetical protein